MVGDLLTTSLVLLALISWAANMVPFAGLLEGLGSKAWTNSSRKGSDIPTGILGGDLRREVA